MNKKALIAMSGGVDSSVATYLMKDRGYECIGATMKLFNNEDIGMSNEKTCCALSDVDDARNVAYKLNIPYYVFNFTSNFKEQVIERFVNAYQNGYTPNPCIDCNRYIKFTKLFSRAKQLEFDYVVTGHYSRIEYDKVNGRYLLKKALDDSKDQSYVLYTMTQNQLAHIKFPLGGLHKTQVREIAIKNGFVNAKKHDSQDICFVLDGDYSKFIETYTGKTYPAGEFVDKNGNVLGMHKGIIRYTIGQRKGLGLAMPQPHYVCSKCAPSNTVTLGTEDELYSKTFEAVDKNLIAYEKIDSPIHVKAKIRYSQKEQDATVEQTEENKLHIEFDAPQKAIAKGQAVVLYDEDTVIGGGTILGGQR